MNYPFYFWPERPLQWVDRKGSNAKQVLILSCSAADATNMDLLHKILKAIDLDFDNDVHFITTSAQHETQLMSDPEISQYSTVVVFGMQPSQIGIPCENSDDCCVFHFENLTCIMAPALEKIESQPKYKKSLWRILRQVFPNRVEG